MSRTGLGVGERMRQGTMINDRYRMDRCVGTGGMGAVWRAQDTRLQRDVAVKVLLPQVDGAEDQGAQTRFEREARITARLQHPNIIGVHDYGIHREAGLATPYVVMSLLTGRSVADALRSGERLDPVRAVEWGVQICNALAAAHAVDVAHRDIKPGNLFLTRHADGTEAVVVLDFGIAAYLMAGHTRLTPAGSGIGTPAYMAPEQARGLRVDGRADLYSLGCVLYELLTGTPPFGFRGSPYAEVEAHLNEQPVPPRHHRPDLPGGLDRVVLQLLAKDPADRPGSALAVAEALRAAVAAPAVATPTVVVATPTAVVATPPPPPLPPATAVRLPTVAELTTAHELAGSLSREGRHNEAAAVLAQVADGRARLLGAAHPDTLRARNNQAYNLGEAGQYREAARLLEQVAADRQRTLGPDHPHTLTSRHNHAYYLGEAGYREEAARLLELVAADRRRVLGPDHPHTLTARHNHACNLGEAGHHGEAARLLEQVAADRHRVLGQFHPQTVKSRKSRAIHAARS
ncbi:serine/threonine-protein kinase [Streptomyces sp. XY431]|uniref:serine/threonine-protein kinase n=1 Tax=Streptomyces sp. XY431 TaxID=1415562 RepID=UPI00133188CE|nr:serine/threonine-protein kinase [Streptomyces sp. XY431]